MVVIQLTHIINALRQLVRLHAAAVISIHHHEVLFPSIQRRKQLLKLSEAHLT